MATGGKLNILHWKARGIAITVAALVAGFGGGTLGGAPSAGAAVACTLQCASGGPICENGGHKVWQAGTLDAGGEFHTPCNDGTCSEWHACALIEGTNLDEVGATVERHADLGAVNELTALLNAPSSPVTFNANRGALQVMACQGTVHLHRPVPASLAVALSELSGQ